MSNPTSIRISDETKKNIKIICAEQEMKMGEFYEKISTYAKNMKPEDLADILN